MAENILKLRVDSAEYDSKIQRAASGLQHFVKACHDQGDVIGSVVGETRKYIQSMGNMETVAKNSKGKLNELTAAYTEIRMVYKNLSDEEKRAPFGKELNKQLEIMKGRIDTLKNDLADVNKELNPSVTSGGLNTQLGDLNGILSQVGGQLGINTSMLSGLTAGTMGYAAAVAAVVKVEYEAAKAFKEYNDELARQSQITTVTTGLKGTDADNMTAAARSIAKVYGADFREVINAANTLMTQFGTDGEFALKTIRDGMQGMIQGDGPKLLQMIQQYAPAFRDAGISASQLVAIIQNSEGGIFSAENMNAIVMGIKNLRLMTKATSDALAEIGINGEKMTRQLNDGTISIFDALRQVSDALQSTESGSQQAGQVMQQVFGRQGTAAGTNLAKAIATLNTNLEETKRQTGEVGESFAELEKKTEELDKAIMNLLKVDNWDVLTNTIEAGVVEGLTKCVNLLNDALDVVDNIGKAFGGPVVQGVVDFLVALSGPVGLIYEAYNLLKGGSGNTPKTETQEEKAQRIATGEKGIVANINSSKDKAGAYAKNMARLNKTLEKYQKEGNEEKAALTQRVIEIVEEHMDKTFSDYGKIGEKFKPVKPVVKPTKASSAEKDKIVTGSMADLMNDLKYLQQEQTKATNTKEWETYQDAIRATQMQIKELKGELKDVPASIRDVAETTNKATDAQNKKIQDRMNDPSVVSKGMAEVVKQISKEQKKDDKKNDKKLTDGLSAFAGGLGGIQSGFKQLGIDLGSGFSDVVNGIQGITSILTAIQSIVTAIEIISSVKFFSHGGIVHAAGGFMVPGNNFSGDLVPAYLNSGEMVLNRFQQQALAGTLENGGMKNISISGHLEGETIALSVDRWGKRSGRGELAFWKNQ